MTKRAIQAVDPDIGYAIKLAIRLIRFNTFSHYSNRTITAWLERLLQRWGFVTENLSYRDAQGVAKHNLVARYGGGTGGLVYFGHTDTVPADVWSQPASTPFHAVVQDGRVYGRGACDMKGSLACMLTAIRSMVGRGISFHQPVYFVATADEEVGYGGARQVVRESQLYREMVTHQTKAIIGEPTGMQIVYAHKGSVLLTATAHGVAAHSSTDTGHNANLAMIPYLGELKEIFDATETLPEWRNTEFNPPTPRWNVTISDDRPAINVTPAMSVCRVYFRSMPEQNVHALIDSCHAAAAKWGLQFEHTIYGEPMYTCPESEFVQAALELAECSQYATAAYGTDGGVFTELEQKIVLGPGSIQQAHTTDEWVGLQQLEAAIRVYQRFLASYCREGGT